MRVNNESTRPNAQKWSWQYGHCDHVALWDLNVRDRALLQRIDTRSACDCHIIYTNANDFATAFTSLKCALFRLFHLKWLFHASKNKTSSTRVECKCCSFDLLFAVSRNIAVNIVNHVWQCCSEKWVKTWKCALHKNKGVAVFFLWVSATNDMFNLSSPSKTTSCGALTYSLG